MNIYNFLAQVIDVVLVIVTFISPHPKTRQGMLAIILLGYVDNKHMI